MSTRAFFEGLGTRVDPAHLDGIAYAYVFVIDEETWHVDARGGRLEVTEGPGEADVTISMSQVTFAKIVAGRQNPAVAYMMGRVKVAGDMGAVSKLQQLLS